MLASSKGPNYGSIETAQDIAQRAVPLSTNALISEENDENNDGIDDEESFRPLGYVRKGRYRLNKPPPHLVPQALMSTIHFAFGVVGIIRFWHEDKHRATVPHNHQPKEQIFHTKEHHTGDATNEHVVSKAVVLGAVRFAFLALVVFQFIVRTRAAHLLIEAHDKVQAGSLWMQHVVNIINTCSVLASFALCTDIISTSKLPSLMYFALLNTTSKDFVLSQIRLVVYGNIICYLVIGLGCGIAEVIGENALRTNVAFEGMEFELGWFGGYLYYMSVIVVNLQAVAGVTALSMLCLLQRVRVESAFRRLMRPSTSTEQAINRVVDIDVSLAAIARSISWMTSVITACVFLKFFFSVLFQNALQKDANTMMAGVGEHVRYIRVVGAVIQPGLLLVYLLTPAAALNQSTLYLKKVCSRFLVAQRNRDLKDRLADRMYKDFINYLKTCDLAWRVSGFHITMGSVWKIMVVTVSAFFTVLRLDGGSLVG